MLLCPFSWVNAGMSPPPLALPTFAVSVWSSPKASCIFSMSMSESESSTSGCTFAGADFALGSACSYPASSLTSASFPTSAAAAAMAGDMRCVRPPAPCRPSKLRLLVLAHRSPGERMSGFIPRHIEQPASRHSKPASSNTLSSPSASAFLLTRPEPGTIIARLRLGATLFPLTICAAILRSSIREFVHDPMKTLSRAISVILVCALSPMYSRARSHASFLFLSLKSSGPGTTPVIGTTSCGLVPHDTVGSISLASMKMSTSYFASGSDRRLSQYLTAFFHSAESGLGARGLPLIYSKVFSSGATRPALAPPSMLMLQIDILASMLSSLIALPQYSITCPVPPAVPILPMTYRMMSLLLTPGASCPSTCTLIFLLRLVTRHCVASTCSTSLVPMPKASAPKAPCVLV